MCFCTCFVYFLWHGHGYCVLATREQGNSLFAKHEESKSRRVEESSQWPQKRGGGAGRTIKGAGGEAAGLFDDAICISFRMTQEHNHEA